MNALWNAMQKRPMPTPPGTGKTDNDGYVDMGQGTPACLTDPQDDHFYEALVDVPSNPDLAARIRTLKEDQTQMKVNFENFQKSIIQEVAQIRQANETFQKAVLDTITKLQTSQEKLHQQITDMSGKLSQQMSSLGKEVEATTKKCIQTELAKLKGQGESDSDEGSKDRDDQENVENEQEVPAVVIENLQENATEQKETVKKSWLQRKMKVKGKNA